MYWKYFKYIIRHKYYVFIAGLKTKAPIHRLILHDWSKFLPNEFIPYARYFNGTWPTKKQQEKTQEILSLMDTPKEPYKVGGVTVEKGTNYYFGSESLYREFQLGKKKISQEEVKEKFDLAWLFHQRRNKHHWQYWVLITDDSDSELRVFTNREGLKIPENYVREMIADWAGAGRAITGNWELGRWYYNNKNRIMLHPKTRELVDRLIEMYYPYHLIDFVNELDTDVEAIYNAD